MSLYREVFWMIFPAHLVLGLCVLSIGKTPHSHNDALHSGRLGLVPIESGVGVIAF